MVACKGIGTIGGKEGARKTPPAPRAIGTERLAAWGGERRRTAVRAEGRAQPCLGAKTEMGVAASKC